MCISCNSPPRRNMRRKQRGISLLEGLISVLLIAITGLGLAHVTAQSLAVQRYATTENQVLLGLREALLQDSNVTSVPVAGTAVGFTREFEPHSVTLSVGDDPADAITVEVQAETLSVTDDPASLVGGDGEFSLGY